MKMRFSLTLLAALLGGAMGGYWFAGEKTAAQPASGGAERQVLYWYDPMVPGQRFDKPGKSPFMDMELVPRYADEQQDDGGVTISARQQQNLGVRTAAAQLRELNLQLDAYGSVATDERGVQVIAARANGLIDKLYVRASQQQVKKGQALAQLWIPDWSAAQQEYLAIRKLGDSALTSAARQRLALQFMPEAIIRQVERSGQPQTRITITAPESGFINKLDAREGMQVTATQGLFELASLDPVWMVIDYPQAQAGLLQVGDAVAASSASWPGERFTGEVSELLPNVDPLTRTFKARIVLKNPQQRLKPGMYLQVQLAQNAGAKPVLAIPQEALIGSGDRNRVLVAEGNGHFAPVDVVAGLAQDGWVEIKQGLQAGQQVVTSGQFLIDSEASMRSALPQMAGQEGVKQYQTLGVVEAVDGATVTLSHDPVAELQWPAMTMDFTLPAGGLPTGIGIGSKVMFHFSVDENGSHISQIMPQGGHQ
ncbi:efflux RND transporter periplasmic adaptor subunit [Serratia fonticola]|jgi:Cu(I)/Ag(I) efflux system membrane fusion protein|uniref:efflux RND transporter periplasmic adaptor subunit n=1 Tax=Serratia fonticola TaxID=47917 RepID=UPI00157699CC|nr:efflux RND transporter periplasmic adaptor subunit [Serratia fonticola]NTY90066.1 efflux RND transporter periplasmic adaptor subunit [Serratia fonticola]NTZ15949.1 efflux RND transporter periplasmic adaptor subunit [Serratia fonticola]CAI0807521.1 Cation efflux system protein CusB precursor [Serratia fonticola]CAI0850918.1 Cation efflux system protein CusB precursor [Serratia fonticola]CAI0938114.1 Cation efflux system protein CusB precursor [Serratia fonticola]